MRLWSALSLVGGRSLAPVRGRKLKEGAILADWMSVLSSWLFGYRRERQADRSSDYYDSYNCENMGLCVKGIRKATRENKSERTVSTLRTPSIESSEVTLLRAVEEGSSKGESWLLGSSAAARGLDAGG
jgi:hypothetical protein